MRRSNFWYKLNCLSKLSTAWVFRYFFCGIISHLLTKSSEKKGEKENMCSTPPRHNGQTLLQLNSPKHYDCFDEISRIFSFNLASA